VIIISILFACMEVLIFYLITLSTKIEDGKLWGLGKHWAWTSKQYIIGLLWLMA